MLSVQFAQKYTIICLLENKEESYGFYSDNWPLHITLAGTFSIEKEVAKLTSMLIELSKTLKPITIAASYDEFFGSEKNIKVTVFEENKDLTALHYDILKLLKGVGVKFNDPQFTEEGFKAHSAVQPHARVDIGESVNVNNLAVVDMFPDQDGHKRKMLKIVKF